MDIIQYKNKHEDISRHVLNKLEIIDPIIYESILGDKTLTIAYLNKLDKNLVIDHYEKNMVNNWIRDEYFDSFYYLAQVNYFPQDSRIQRLGNYCFWYGMLTIAMYIPLVLFIYMNKGFVYVFFSFLVMSIFEFGKVNVSMYKILYFYKF